MEDGDIRVVNLTRAIRTPTQVSLSEIADSISFIALETNNSSLLSDFLNFRFYQDYIFSNNYCFDWTGKFIGELGQRGNGPCEDPASRISKAIYKNEHFYTVATKIIEYDRLMQCTNKELILYRLQNDGRPVEGSTYTNFVSVANAKENIIVYNYPDSVYFIDVNFNFISSQQVIFPVLSSFVNPLGGQYSKFMTNYGDTTLFYNFFNDTVYYANNNHLSPAWIIDLSDEMRVPADLLYRWGELNHGAFTAWENGNINNSELIRLTDHKTMVMSVYETSGYLFLIWIEMIQYAPLRNNKTPAIPQIAFFDKQTGKTTSVKGNGFVDDIFGMDSYLPLWGACNNMLIKSVWPWELQELVDNNNKLRENKQLMDVLSRTKPEDNPILIVAHLKQ